MRVKVGDRKLNRKKKKTTRLLGIFSPLRSAPEIHSRFLRHRSRRSGIFSPFSTGATAPAPLLPQSCNLAVQSRETDSVLPVACLNLSPNLPSLFSQNKKNLLKLCDPAAESLQQSLCQIPANSCKGNPARWNPTKTCAAFQRVQNSAARPR